MSNEAERSLPNTNICPICTAQPGTLPVPNRTAIEWIVKAGTALGCTINTDCKFDRKQYFYPDLPKAYQISQFDQPIAEHGKIELKFLTGKNHREQAVIGITRIHLEEDTAKLLHGESGTTLVDFNRAGVPLMEIVSEPDIQSAAEAKAYCQELQMVFRALGISEADMEKGAYALQKVNVSLQEEDRFENINGVITPIADYKLNPKVEVKNINSFRAVEKAIEFEIKRQTELLSKGETWKQQTRGWSEEAGGTLMQREKETSADYRYFPEPDIPPFNPVTIAGPTPELPAQIRTRFHEEYGFSYADAYILSADKHWVEFTEGVMSDLYSWIGDLPETKNDAENIISAKKPN